MIILTSDVLGNVTEEMWDAMRNARLGWGIRGDGNLINLIERIKELTGKEAALLAPSCTMANLAALMTHGSSGQQVIFEEQAHTYWSEEWGFSYVARLFPKVVRGDRGIMSPESVEEAILDARFNHKPETAVLCLENTHMGAGGTVYTPELTDKLCNVAHKHGVKVHLDGARLFNAAIALKVSAKELARFADSVSINLNKGLGAPEGALLCGSSEFIDRAKINIKRIGGNSMHKAGLIAAAGLVALKDENIRRLAEDHRRAREFAEGIAPIKGIEVDMETVRTNIAIADITKTGMNAEVFLKKLADRNVSGYKKTNTAVRFTFHNGINNADVKEAINAVKDVCEGC